MIVRPSRHPGRSRLLTFATLMVGLVWASGCGPNNFRVDRSALVGLPLADVTSGDPAGSVEFGVGNGTVVFATEPRLSPASQVGLYVPRFQPTTLLRAPVHEFLHMRGVFEIFSAYGAMEINPSPIEPARGFGWALGPGIGVSAYASHHLWLGASLDTMFALTPSHVVITDADNGMLVEDRNRVVPVLLYRLTLSAAYHAGIFELTGSIAARNHPVNVAREFVTATSTIGIRAGVNSGPPMLLPTITVAVRPKPEIAIALNVSNPIDLTGTAVTYGPIVSLAFTAAIPAKGGMAARMRDRRPPKMKRIAPSEPVPPPPPVEASPTPPEPTTTPPEPTSTPPESAPISPESAPVPVGAG